MMRQIDKLHLEHPFARADAADMLRAKGFTVGRKHVATLMKRMGVEAPCRRPNTNRKHPGNPIYPYLLQGLPIERANHVWAMDITYIPMVPGIRLPGGDHRLGQPPGAGLGCVDLDGGRFPRARAGPGLGAPRPAVDVQHRPGQPVHQRGFTGRLSAESVRISMDGKGCWRDNVFVERLWKSVKYEEVDLRAYDTVSHARASIGRYLDFYNARRPHTAHKGKTPDQAYFTQLSPVARAA